MKALAITILMAFSTTAFALDDFYTRYLKEVAVCMPKSREWQSMAMYYFCAAGTVQNVTMGEPVDERPLYAHFITKFQAQGTAWERFEYGLITEAELNETLGRIDRNE